MKLDCHIVRDLLAGYADGVLSGETAAQVKEHLDGCEPCSRELAAMTAPVDKAALTPPADRSENTANVAYLKKYRRTKTALIIVAAALGTLVLILSAFFGATMLAVGAFACSTEHDIAADPAQYEEYLGAEGKYRTTYFGTDEIFPDALPDSANVEAFRCEYYNPWDANILGYLVYTCDDEDFAAEYARLKSVDSSEDYRVYGIESFPYELCAVRTNEYYGVTYALADAENDRLIYFELQFCNLFTDIDYERYVDPQYLPAGFDASVGNANRTAYEIASCEEQQAMLSE